MGITCCKSHDGLIPPHGTAPDVANDAKKVKSLQRECLRIKEAHKAALNQLANMKKGKNALVPIVEPEADVQAQLEEYALRAQTLEAKLKLLESVSMWSVVPTVPSEYNCSLMKVRLESCDIKVTKLKNVEQNISSRNLLSEPARKAKSEVDELQDMHIVVTVVDDKGQVVGKSCRTPKGNMLAPLYILCPGTPEQGQHYVFFQIKCAKKKQLHTKMSTRCFAFHDIGKISKKNRPFKLKLYKKPTDFTRDPESITPLGMDSIKVYVNQMHQGEDLLVPDTYIH